MIAPWAFDNRVTIQHKTSTYDGINKVDTWTDLATKWCCVSQGTTSHRTNLQINEGERMAKNSRYRLRFQDRFFHLFSDKLFFANYRFYWVDEARYLLPVSTVNSPGKKSSNYSFIWVEDITDFNGT